VSGLSALSSDDEWDLWVTPEGGCVPAPVNDWLSLPINLQTVDWPKTFRELETANLYMFGEHVNQPKDF
jgi:hypothetical protein